MAARRKLPVKKQSTRPARVKAGKKLAGQLSIAAVSANRMAYRLRALAHRMEDLTQNIRNMARMVETRSVLRGDLVTLVEKDISNAQKYICDRQYEKR